MTAAICLGFGDETKLGPHVRVLRRPRRVPCIVEAAGTTLVGVATALSCALKNCPCNAHGALCSRHGLLRPMVVATLDEFDDFVRCVGQCVASVYPPKRTWLYDHWIDRWSMEKRLAIARSEAQDPYEPGKCKVMVKREGYTYGAVGRAMPTKARLIQFYHNLATQARGAPYVAAMQESAAEVIQRLDIGGGVKVTFACGMDNRGLGGWMQAVMSDYSPVFYERDGKAWDSTMGRLHHDLKQSIYSVAGRELSGYIEDCYETKNTYRFYRSGLREILQYRVTGTTRSGHNDTSLGNSLVNAAIAWRAMRGMGLTGDIIVAGDDLLVAVNGDYDANEFARHEAEAGIVPEFRKFHCVYDVSFISGIWVPGVAGYNFVPKPGRLLSKLWWTVNPPSKKQFEKYRSGVVLGLAPACAGMPVITQFLLAHLSVVDARPIRKYHYSLERQEFGPEIYRWFMARYGLRLDEVRALESRLEHNSTPAVLVDRTAERIMEVDLADLLQRRLYGEW